MSLDAGTRIGRYEIQSLIGAGGMGEVYRALDHSIVPGFSSDTMPYLARSPDGQAVDYVVRREGASGLRRLPLAPGGRPRQLADLKTYFINWYAWSFDGRQLAVARGNPITDMILIKDFK
jgi:serine/threonine protein kinase